LSKNANLVKNFARNPELCDFLPSEHKAFLLTLLTYFISC